MANCNRPEAIEKENINGFKYRNHTRDSNLIIRRASKTVAIVVPLNRAEFTSEEETSFRHLVHFLGKYDKYFIAPRSLKIEYPDFGIKRFNDKYFGSAAAHTKLMLAPKLYKAFREYKYILIYHLDSLVFSDQLMQWCETGLDYIGPPWLVSQDSPWVKHPHVGNGGFCLRKIDSILKVLHSPAFFVDPAEYWKRHYALKPKPIQYLNLPKKYLKRLAFLNGVRQHISDWCKIGHNEDRFWCSHATQYYPEFKIASVETGLRFAFEVAPRLCFELNNHTLPFGCHAWHKYDRGFWEPYLLK